MFFVIVFFRRVGDIHFIEKILFVVVLVSLFTAQHFSILCLFFLPRAMTLILCRSLGGTADFCY